MSLLALGIRQVEAGRVPDWITRAAIRRRLRGRMATLPDDPRAAADVEARFVVDQKARGIAEVPDLANAQHYEVPAAFFAEVLGPRRKYSCCYYGDGVADLHAAEEYALRETAAHADLADGQDVLELGCGWGSLSLWMAETYPGSRITAVSNSASQRAYIEGEADRRGLGNLRVVTADMNVFDPAADYDRIVSVEMFEHMSNWQALLDRVARWLRDDGRFFMHVFTHRLAPYRFADEGADNWMGRYFFSGGIMPSHGLIHRYDRTLQVEAEWRWNGIHYAWTAIDWLANLDRARPRVMPILRGTYGAEAEVWFHRWRLFFLAVEQLFRYGDGEVWGVSHYRLRKPA